MSREGLLFDLLRALSARARAWRHLLLSSPELRLFFLVNVFLTSGMIFRNLQRGLCP